MRQTAVEWFGKELESYGDPQYCEIEWKQLDSLIEQAKEWENEQMVGFHKWMLEMNKPEHAERYFHFSDTDMLNEYLKSQKL